MKRRSRHRILGNQFRKPDGILGRILSKIMLFGNKAIYENLISELDIKENDKVFEIGYSHGNGIKTIATKHNCFVSGIDFSKLMYSEASKRNKSLIKSQKVVLEFGDFLDIEPQSSQYDKIYCIHVIYFWPQLSIAFKKIKEMLGNHGLFCIYMANEDFGKQMRFAHTELFNLHSLDNVICELRKVGFEKPTYTSGKNGYYIKCQKATTQAEHITTH